MQPFNPPPGNGGYGGFGTPPGYGPPQAPQGSGGFHSDAVPRIEKEGLTWLIVAAVGFFFGVPWITGPLAWWQGARLRREYRSLGMEPTGNANVAWILGMVSTAFGVLVFLGVCVFAIAIAVGIAAAPRHG